MLLYGQDLRAQLPAGLPMWAVDTACLYPMQLTARAPAKAYIFRSSTDKPRKERLAQMPYASGSRNWANFLASCRVGRTPFILKACRPLFNAVLCSMRCTALQCDW